MSVRSNAMRVRSHPKWLSEVVRTSNRPGEGVLMAFMVSLRLQDAAYHIVGGAIGAQD